MQRNKKSRANAQKLKAQDQDKNAHQVLPKEFEKLPDNVKSVYIEAQSFKGPLPPPSMFGQYEDILKGSAERIFQLTEKEQKHRMTWESRVLEAQISSNKRGQIMGFSLGIISILAVAFCAYMKQPIIGIVSIIPVVAGIVTLFISKNRNSESDNDFG